MRPLPNFLPALPRSRAAAASAASRGRVRLLPRMPHGLVARLLLAAALAGALAGAYGFWFRDSTFVAVTRIEVTGVSGREGERLRGELIAAARTMSTLHVREDALRRIAAAHPGVASLEAAPEFPHKLTIRVAERRPVAVVGGPGGKQLVVASDGILLETPPPGPLPRLGGGGGAPGGRVPAGDMLGAVRMTAGAPDALLPRVATVRRTPDLGWVAELRDGPRLILGGEDAVVAKWAAAATVLGDPEARAATYIDVRLPARPAVGGLAVEPPAPARAPLGEAPEGAAAGAQDAAPAPAPEAGAPASQADPNGAQEPSTQP